MGHVEPQTATTIGGADAPGLSAPAEKAERAGDNLPAFDADDLSLITPTAALCDAGRKTSFRMKQSVRATGSTVRERRAWAGRTNL